MEAEGGMNFLREIKISGLEWAGFEEPGLPLRGIVK